MKHFIEKLNYYKNRLSVMKSEKPVLTKKSKKFELTYKISVN
jgi:hypothetical protein